MECVATCRPGLEGVLEEEIRALGGEGIRSGKRAVTFTTDKGGLYRINMALRSAIQVLVPLRRFNARDYQLLYYQSRRTNWHQLFEAGKTLRIDVNGRSPTLRNTQYVVHRVKDGIVDTFRKLSGGVRPSIEKAEPEIHVVVHLHGTQATLCLDSSGVPLFKRGYRLRHGAAPLKEDLAAGILLLCGEPGHTGLVDPMCGSGTFLFEGWMLRSGIAPNLERTFAFQNWLDYDPGLLEAERDALGKAAMPVSDQPLKGFDHDREAIRVAEEIRSTSFPEAPIEFRTTSFQNADAALPGALMVANPPYGERLGTDTDLPQLYRELGFAAKRMVPGGELAVFTTNRKAARQIPLKAAGSLTLFNGPLEGVLYRYPVRES